MDRKTKTLLVGLLLVLAFASTIAVTPYTISTPASLVGAMFGMPVTAFACDRVPGGGGVPADC